MQADVRTDLRGRRGAGSVEKGLWRASCQPRHGHRAPWIGRGIHRGAERECAAAHVPSRRRRTDGADRCPGAAREFHTQRDQPTNTEPAPCYRQALALKRTSTSEPLDLNNMVGVEFSTFAGLYPTIGGKLIKAAPFASKQEAYDSLETDAERAQLKVYDANIVIKPRNDDVMQVGASVGTLAQYYRARLLGTDSRRPGTD